MLGSALRHYTNGHSPRPASNERRASPLRFASPLRRTSPVPETWTGEAANGAAPRWLLEPSDSCFASPQPAGSFTELSAGCYQYKASPEQLYLDLERCNRALRALLEQNSSLKSQLKAAQTAQEEATFKPTPSHLEREEMVRNKIKSATSQGSSMSSIPTPSSHGSAFLSDSEFFERLMSLSRMADQEMAVTAYRDVLRQVGKALGHWEKMVKQLRRETIREQEEALLLEDQLDYEVATFEIERMLLLADLDAQAEEAERAIGELRMQLDSAERRMRWTKNKADARIAELSLVVATSHLDVERLQQENDILRNQMEIERQRRNEYKHKEETSF